LPLRAAGFYNAVIFEFNMVILDENDHVERYHHRKGNQGAAEEEGAEDLTGGCKNVGFSA